MRIQTATKIFIQLLFCVAASSLWAQSDDPITFELVNTDGDNIVYIDNAKGPGEKMFVKMVNSDSHPLFFGKLTNDNPSKNNFHIKLEIRHNNYQYFTKATLGNINLGFESKEAWNMTVDTSDNEYAYFYFINVSKLELQYNIANYIGLTGFKASSKSGPNASVDTRLYYQNAFYSQAPKVPISSNFDNEIRIKNRSGLENLPLHAGLLGAQSILNDGETPNALLIGLENIAIPNPLTPIEGDKIYYDTSTTFIISYRLEPNTTPPWTYPWALTTKNEFAKITNTPTVKFNGQVTTDWQVTKTSDKDAWLVEALTSGSLSPKDVLSIELTDIVSAMPDGVSHIYVHYSNVEGYYDGFFSIPVTKSSLVERKNKLGLEELPTASQSLQVDGGLQVTTGYAGFNGSLNNGYAFSEHYGTGLFNTKPNDLRLLINDEIGMWLSKGQLYLQGDIFAELDLIGEEGVVAANTIRAGSAITAANTISADSTITAGGAIYAKGGRPGGWNKNNAGFATKGKNGDEDSGMYSAADGEAILYTNGSDRLVVNSSAVTVKEYVYPPDAPAKELFSIDNDGWITYAPDSTISYANTIMGGTEKKPVTLKPPYGSTDEWAIFVSLEGFGHEAFKNLNWMIVSATPNADSTAWNIVGEVCQGSVFSCWQDAEPVGPNTRIGGTPKKVHYIIARK